MCAIFKLQPLTISIVPLITRRTTASTMLSPPPSSLPARPPTPTDFTIFPDAPKNRAPAEVLDPHNSTKLEPRQPRTLLVEALTGRKRAKPPHEQNHDQYLLKTQLGRDFALRTSAGVEFKIHVTKILGRSKTLQEYIFPGQVRAEDQLKHRQGPCKD